MHSEMDVLRHCNPCTCRVGDAVFGQATGCLGTAVLVDARTVVAMPPSLTFVQAATVPTVFLTAQHCLVDVAAVGAPDRVLVHAATGAPSASAHEASHVLVACDHGLEKAILSHGGRRRLGLGGHADCGRRQRTSGGHRWQCA